MKKNPFKSKGLTTSLVNTGIGGAANVAVDYAIDNIEALASLDRMYINAGKMVGGVLLGTMTGNKYLHAATDGIAVVGASELVRSLISTPATTEGLPKGTVGRVTMGDRYFRGAARRGNGGGFTVNGAMQTVLGK